MPSASAAPADAAPDTGAGDLYAALAECLAATAPADKLAAVDRLARDHAAGLLAAPSDAPPAPPIGTPGRPARPVLVAPRDVPQRGLGSADGRAALLHAVAHIEFNAINLALDAAFRFRDMPDAYRADWISVAADEARHFAMLQARLAALGVAYGDFAAHDGLWEMAQKTADGCLARMALVPRVLEARGLDVTPGLIRRLRGQGDAESAAVLEVILAEEVRHVAIGSHWFAWCCAAEGRDPDSTFLALVREHSRGAIRGPFNLEARLAGGFAEAELRALLELSEKEIRP
jgi:uncharacterized ferritin-like protein (DUF455 family)